MPDEGLYCRPMHLRHVIDEMIEIFVCHLLDKFGITHKEHGYKAMVDAIKTATAVVAKHKNS